MNSPTDPSFQHAGPEILQYATPVPVARFKPMTIVALACLMTVAILVTSFAFGFRWPGNSATLLIVLLIGLPIAAAILGEIARRDPNQSRLGRNTASVTMIFGGVIAVLMILS